MKRTVITTLLLLVSAAFSYAQQTITSENLNEFTAVNMTGNVTAQLIPADTNRIEIILTDVDINKFKWNIKGTTLNVELNSGSKGKGHADVKLYYMGPLTSISISGGELSTPEPVIEDILKFSVSGGAKVTAEFDVLDLDVNVSSNSVVLLSGVTKYLTMRAGEKSKVDARQMDCVAADIDTATGAEVYVTVEERLVGNAKTSSTIFYRGKPSILKDKTSKMSAGMMGSSILYIGE